MHALAPRDRCDGLCRREEGFENIRAFGGVERWHGGRGVDRYRRRALRIGFAVIVVIVVCTGIGEVGEAFWRRLRRLSSGVVLCEFLLYGSFHIEGGRLIGCCSQQQL